MDRNPAKNRHHHLSSGTNNEMYNQVDRNPAKNRHHIYHQGPTMGYNQVDRNPAKKKATALTYQLIREQ